MTNEVSLLQAWQIWFTGATTDSLVLWGLSIHWWERIGKIIQFVSAATIVAEILGPDRLRSFGNSLHSKITLPNLRKRMADCWSWIIHLRNISDDDAWMTEVRKFKSDIYFAPSFLVVLIAGGFLIWKIIDMKMLAVLLIILYLPLTIVLAPAIILIATALVNLFGLVLDFCIIEPLAWALELPNLDKIIKVISILLLFIGFHFDLLGS